MDLLNLFKLPINFVIISVLLGFVLPQNVNNDYNRSDQKDHEIHHHSALKAEYKSELNYQLPAHYYWTMSKYKRRRQRSLSASLSAAAAPNTSSIEFKPENTYYNYSEYKNKSKIKFRMKPKNKDKIVVLKNAFTDASNTTLLTNIVDTSDASDLVDPQHKFRHKKDQFTIIENHEVVQTVRRYKACVRCRIIPGQPFRETTTLRPHFRGMFYRHLW